MRNLNTMRVPFNDLSRRYLAHKEAIMTIAERVLESGQYVLGREVKSLEQSFASFIGLTDSVGVNSGTDALAIALKSLGIGDGDEVITVANTCAPTIAAIRMAGARPVFADIQEDTLLIDPEDAERRITARTKAILPVHLYGFPADMDRIGKIAHTHKIFVVEDCAQAIGAGIGGALVGSFGDAAAFSFYPTKNVGAFGDGGIILARDSDTLARARRLRMYGEENRNESLEDGVNSRLDEIQAALISWGMENINSWNNRRRVIAARMKEGIQNHWVTLPIQSQDSREGVWHLFVVRVEDRNDFIAHLSECGVSAAIHYPIPMYDQPAYRSFGEDGSTLPITKRNSGKVVSLPLFPEMTDDEIEAVISAVNSYKAN